MADEEAARRLRRRLQELHRRQRRETPAIDGISRGAARVLGAIARATERVELSEGQAAGEAAGTDDGRLAPLPGVGKRAHPSTLAEELGMQRSNLATALRELEDADLIRRETDPGDRRGVLVRLSPAGEKAVALHRNGRDTWFAATIEAALTPEEQARLFAAGELLERLARFEGGDET